MTNSPEGKTNPGNESDDGGGRLLPCIRCGELTADRLGDKPICRACYEVRSSCCPEFGPDDLTDPE